MKKTCLLFFLLFIFFCLWHIRPTIALAGPHLGLSPSSGVITADGTSIVITIDTDGQAAKSAKAVINFDSTLLEVSSVQAGDFFDDVSHNIYNSSGQVVVNANLSLGSMLESKTGTGTLATMTVTAKASTGTATMTFDCTSGSSTDSNINDPTPLDIIDCSSNVSGSYTLGEGTAGVSPTPTPSASADAAVGGDGDGDGNGDSTAPIPVTGVSWPTLVLLGAGLVLIFTPVLSKM